MKRTRQQWVEIMDRIDNIVSAISDVDSFEPPYDEDEELEVILNKSSERIVEIAEKDL